MPRAVGRSALVLLVEAALACTPNPPPEDTDAGLWIGALLPFTGSLAAGAANYERGMILAREAINDAGGVGAGPLQIFVQDTHSDVAQAAAAARIATGRASTLALVGPDDPSSITAMAADVESSAIVQMLPGITAPPITGRGDNHWFRILPSALATGCALAQRLYEDGRGRIVVLYEDDDFSRSLADGVVQVFTGMPAVEQQVLAKLALDPKAADHGDVLASVYALDPAAVVLIAGAKVGAALVNDWNGPAVKWYFGPSMNTMEFVVNTLPGQLTEAMGIAAAIPDSTSEPFAEAYSKRWAGDFPLIGAYAYYDAVAIVALAAESASRALGGRLPSRQELRDHIERVSQPPGTAVTWDGLAAGFELIRSGGEVNYQGASGRVDLASSGVTDPSIALLRFWKIENETIVPTEYGSCVWLTP